VLLRDVDVPDFFFATVEPVVAFEAEVLAVFPVAAAPATLSVGPEFIAGTVDDAVAVSALDWLDGRHATIVNATTRTQACWNLVINCSPSSRVSQASEAVAARAGTAFPIRLEL
jgi:hypothetical protein